MYVCRNAPFWERLKKNRRIVRKNRFRIDSDSIQNQSLKESFYPSLRHPTPPHATPRHPTPSAKILNYVLRHTAVLLISLLTRSHQKFVYFIISLKQSRDLIKSLTFSGKWYNAVVILAFSGIWSNPLVIWSNPGFYHFPATYIYHENFVNCGEFTL